MDAQCRTEDCRREVLRFLATRDQLAHSPEAIRRATNREGFDFSASETLSALRLLCGLGLALEQTEPLGASKYYQISAQGVLTHERTSYE